MVLDRCLVARLGVCHYASCHCTRYLTHQHELALGRTYHHGATLVFGARFGKIGGHEAAGMVYGIDNLAVDGKPVGMHIHRTHEHTELDATAFQIFRLIGLFESDNLSVGRSHDGVDRITRKIAARRAVEVHHKQVEHHRNTGQDRRNPYIGAE